MNPNNFSLLRVGAVVVSLLIFGQVAASDLIKYTSSSQLNDLQQRYYLSESSNPVHDNVRLAIVDFTVFENNILNISLDEFNFTYFKEEDRTGEGKFWIGKIDESQNQYAHFVINNDRLIGNVVAGDETYVIRPLTGGLHLVARVNFKHAVDCQNDPTMEHEEEEDLFTSAPRHQQNHIDIQQEAHRSSSTGECKVRVLVVYTDMSDAVVADILSDINNQVNLANTGFLSSGVPNRVELAAVYEEIYNEAGQSMLSDITYSAADSIIWAEFDDVFTQRILWDADQVMLIHSGGGGKAWQSVNYNKAFSIMGVNNFDLHTFHHELAHNYSCKHDVAPFQGYGESTDGCFRTIMALGSACGTGPCPRQNIFSSEFGNWSCGGNLYAHGSPTHKCAEALSTHYNTIKSYEEVVNISIYGGNYDWYEKEAVHRAANQIVGYSSATSNQFELHDGSEGSFRASDEVVLGEGFWAKSGSEFRAYLESCVPVPATVISKQDHSHDLDVGETIESSTHRIHIYPNPLTEFATLELTLHEELSITIQLFDITGKEVQLLADQAPYQSGFHRIALDVQNLSAGPYLCRVILGNVIETQRLTIIK